MARIVIVTRGTAGDIVPFLQIGSVALSRNNDVTLITHCHYEERARRLGLRFEALDTPEQFQAFLNDGPLLERPTSSLDFVKKHLLPRVTAEIDLLRRHCQEPGVIVIARHMGSIAAPLVCELYGAPFVSVFLVAAQASCFAIWREFCRTMLASHINTFRRELELGPILNWDAWVRMPASFLACWPDWFSKKSPAWPENTRHVGFLRHDPTEAGELPEPIKSLLRSQPRPVLITGGTSVSNSAKRFYSVAAAACQIANRSAVLVCPHEELRPYPLPPLVVHARELPFASLMPHSAAVVHHGGAGTMVRALASAAPQLILPFGADRPENAARIEKLGLGARIDPVDWKPSLVARELDRVIESNSIRQALSDVRNRISSPLDLANACASIEDLASASHNLRDKVSAFSMNGSCG